MASVHGVRSEDTIRRFAPVGIYVAAEAELLLEAEVADVEGVVPIAGIKAFITNLDPNSWAVVTSAPRSLTEVRLRAAGLPVPKTLIAAEDVQRGQPEPEGFLKAAKLLGVPISECLVFEDSPAGVAAAKSAGAHVAIVGDLVPAEEGMLSIVNYSASLECHVRLREKLVYQACHGKGEMRDGTSRGRRLARPVV
jgi:mannitol-1-/sugar-/sorbitol-6-phosphatase